MRSDGVYQLVTSDAAGQSTENLQSIAEKREKLEITTGKRNLPLPHRHKKRQLFFVVLFILAIVAQLILRNFITEQIYKNLITISAILTVLPMANLASPLVVASRIPEVPEELHKACLPYEDKFRSYMIWSSPPTI